MKAQLSAIPLKHDVRRSFGLRFDVDFLGCYLEELEEDSNQSVHPSFHRANAVKTG
jgi:hypothetical protein